MASNADHRSRLVTDEHRAEFDSMMSMLKGLSTYQATIALNHVTPNVDWIKSTKGLIAEDWARRNDVLSASSLKSYDERHILKGVAKVKARYGLA